MRACRYGLVVSALVVVLGLQWALLQTFAWSQMLFRYSRIVPLRMAIEMTLDGKHPCELCLAIKQGRDSERRQPWASLESGSRLETALTTSFFGILLPGNPVPPEVRDSMWSARSVLPPKPRPRSGFAA